MSALVCRLCLAVILSCYATAYAVAPAPPTNLGLSAPSASSMSDIIDSLSVNEWARLPATWSGGTLDFWKPSPSTGSITDYTHQGFYDPVRRKVFFVGAGYGSISSYVVYDEMANVWSRTVMSENIIHSWDHVAYDASRGYLYFSGELGGSLRRIDVDTGTLTTDGSLPINDDTYGMEYWPSLDSIIVSGQKGVAYRKPFGESFAVFATGLPRVSYQSMLVYDPVRNVMYQGGGNGTETDFSEIASDGTVTILPDAFFLYVFSSVGLASGDFVVRRTDGGSPEMSKYDGTWSSFSSAVPAFVTGKRNSFGVRIDHPTSTIFMYVVSDMESSDVQVWLYRYQ